MPFSRRLEYAEIDGTVSCGAMSSTESTHYRGQMVMNTEEEGFFSALTVGDTINLAARLKVPFHLPPGVKDAKKAHRTIKNSC